MKDSKKETRQSFSGFVRLYRGCRYLHPLLLALVMMTVLPPESAFGQNPSFTVKIASEQGCSVGTVLFSRTYTTIDENVSQDETITVEYGSWVCLVGDAYGYGDLFIFRIEGGRRIFANTNRITYDYRPVKFPGEVAVPLGESYGDDGVTHGFADVTFITLHVVVRNAQIPQIKLALPALMLTDRDPHTFNADDHFTDTGIGITSTTESPDKLTYTALSHDPSVAAVSLSGSMVSVTARSEGSATISVTATDLAGNTTLQTFSAAVDLPPAAAGTIDPLFLTSGEGTGTRSFSFSDAGTLTYTVSTGDPDIATAVITPGTAAVTVTPAGAGMTTVTVTASDGTSMSSQSFDVTVLPSPPVITGGSERAVSTEENQVAVTTVSAAGSGVVSYSVSGGADLTFFQIDAASGVLTFDNAPDFESTTHTNTYTAEVIAVATQSGLDSRPSATQTITVTVTNVLEITSNGGSEYSLDLPENRKEVATIETDHHNDDGALIWSIDENDALVFEISQAGVLSFKDAFVPDYENSRNAEGVRPSNNQGYWVVVTATNDNGSDTQLIKVTVTDVVAGNLSPELIALSPSFALVLSIAVQEESVAFVRPSGGGGDVVSYSITPALPAGLTFSTITGHIRGTPTAVAGSTMYTITGTNSAGSSFVTIAIEVATDTQPGFSSDSDIADQTYIAGKHSVNLTLPEATGGNAPLTYALNPSLLPEGLTLDPMARTITGVPGVMTSGMYTWTVTDANGDMDMVSGMFGISVLANSVPQFSSPPKTITFTQGTSYSGMSGESLSEATGGNGSLVYTLTPELPSGLIFSTDERTITGTPAVAGTTTHTYAATDSGDPAGATAAEGPDATTQTVTVIVLPLPLPLPLSAKEAVTAGISIYPNAATDVIHISNVVENVYYTLSDTHGKTLKTGILTANKKEHSLDISSLRAGIYLLKITIGRASTTRRIVKQ